MRDELDYYEILQISPKADPGTIHAAYRKLAHKYHPDVNRHPSAHERMRELNQALEVLTDPGWRAEYDRRRRGFLAQPAAAANPPIFIIPPLQQESVAIGVWDRLTRPPVAWLVIAGSVAVTLVAMAMIAFQLASDSGGGDLSRRELAALADSDLPARSARAEGASPPGSPRAQTGETPPATPTPLASLPPDASTTPQVLSAVRDDTRPGSGTGPAAATPTPAAVAVVPPAPNPAPAPPPPLGTPPPSPTTPTPPLAECSAAGAPQVNENGNQVHFSYGTVVGFQDGDPAVLVVDVTGTLLTLAITGGTDVQGELDAATVVNGQGRRSNDGSILAQQVDVVCPEWAQ